MKIKGAINYKCVSCKKDVTIEYTPAPSQKADKFFKKMIDKKLCSKCIKDMKGIH